MAEFVDVDYANKASSRVERYKIVNQNPFKANFRCPFCLDSKKSKTKSRGWLLEKDNKLHYYCHNCFASMGFVKFLKNLDVMLYKDYLADRFMSGSENENKMTFNYKPKGVVTSSGNSGIIFQKNVADVVVEKEIDPILNKIKKISDLNEDHPAKAYIASRQMPPESYDRLYYVPKFRNWVNSIIPDKFPNTALENDEPRIILPFCDVDGKMFGFTGRSFDPDANLRYVSIMIDGTKDKFFGLDNVDFLKKYFVFEGGIDSLFVKNSCAMAGADAKLDVLKHKENGVIVYDNEPRNPNIHKKMEDALNMGFSIVIWPDYIKEKDVNNMILYEHMTKEDIFDVLTSHTFKGMMGKLELNKWKRSESDAPKKKWNF